MKQWFEDEGGWGLVVLIVMLLAWYGALIYFEHPELISYWTGR